MSCDIQGGQNGIATSFSLSFFPFPLPEIAPPLLHTRHHRPLQCDILLTRKHFDTSSVFGLWASTQLRHLAGCSEQLFSTGGTKVWKSEDSRGWRTENVSVITVTYDVTSKYDINLHALYGEKREPRHLQSWNRIHYIWVLWNVSHCNDMNWFCVSAVCQTDIGRLIDQAEDSIIFTFSPSYTFCVPKFPSVYRWQVL